MFEERPELNRVPGRTILVSLNFNTLTLLDPFAGLNVGASVLARAAAFLRLPHERDARAYIKSLPY